MTPLYLKKDEERRLKAGHLWVFSNEVDTRRTPLGEFPPGAEATLYNNHGKPLGRVYVNPNALICARLFSRDPQRALASLLAERLRCALGLRTRLFDQPYYRLAFGESDGLPGLIVDRYDDIAVAQITTAGMERCRQDVADALREVIQPAALIWRNDSDARALEGLDSYVATAFGEPPAQLHIVENNTRFTSDAMTGQKTGWFYDHRMNRARMQHYVKDRQVLDVFSYTGGWGIQAVVAGAARVLCIDSSKHALEQLQSNASLNHVEDVMDTQHGDAFDLLRALAHDGRRFDTIILDPPAFIKRKKDIAAGSEAYQRLNRLALQLLNDEGMLITSSCSYHLGDAMFKQVLLKAARQSGRQLQLIEQGHQSPDHPIHPAMPETSYLKTLFMRVLPP